MEKKTVLITGVTGTIGKATATELATKGCRLILMGRDAGKVSAVRSEIISLTANNDLDISIADLSEPASVRQAASEIKSRYPSLNALLNIAAIFKNKRLENSTGLEYMFATNHLGPFILTNALLDLIKPVHGRIVTVTAPSTTKINFDDLQGKKKFSAGFLGSFGASKMMNIMFTYSLARRLKESGATAMAFHPGLVKSDLTNEMPAFINFIFKSISGKPDKPAGMLCRLAIDSDFEDLNGTFYKFNGTEMRSSDYSHNEEIQEHLWSVSEQLAG